MIGLLKLHCSINFSDLLNKIIRQLDPFWTELESIDKILFYLNPQTGKFVDYLPE